MKNLSFTTRHQLTFHPHFANTDHQLQVMGRFEITTSNNSTQYLSSNGIGGGITDPTVPWLPYRFNHQHFKGSHRSRFDVNALRLWF